MIDCFPEDDRDRAVSPVIGVILMVAITVILAAVIGTFVLNLSDSVNEQASAGVSINNSGNVVTVTSMGDSTDYVACITSGGSENTTAGQAGSVGQSITCGDGENVVAFATGDAEDKTIATNI